MNTRDYTTLHLDINSSKGTALSYFDNDDTTTPTIHI